MSTVFNLLDRIQASPGMYLGYPSVSSLFMFLNGYESARGELDIELTEPEEIFYDSFQPWLQKKLGILSVTSWAKLIMLSCHDEKTGFERFFELLSEFQQEKNLSMPSDELRPFLNGAPSAPRVDSVSHNSSAMSSSPRG